MGKRRRRCCRLPSPGPQTAAAEAALAGEKSATDLLKDAAK
jgi:hypothetical protein